jgi:hypothetical protein
MPDGAKQWVGASDDKDWLGAMLYISFTPDDRHQTGARYDDTRRSLEVASCEPSWLVGRDSHQRLTPGNARIAVRRRAGTRSAEGPLRLRAEDAGGCRSAELHDLLAETLETKEGRAFMPASPPISSARVLSAIRPWLTSCPQSTAEHDRRHRSRRSPDSESSTILRKHSAYRVRALPPVPNTLFQRDRRAGLWR